MVDKNKVLDEVIRREKKSKIKRILKYATFALVFGGIYSYSQFKNYDQVKFTKELGGVIESVQKVNSEDGQIETVYSIKLSNNTVVNIPKNRLTNYVAGDEIKVLRQELESGKKRYSIVINK